ncbi:uncharacterized protein LOC118181160, partial [Stegodyphus dumicola]|uniref:uncharacterized protein LOC118181160 n=1 Tax=Stegodyphus dumicola TaxID=202533 RepID=UPI0015B12AF4
MPKRAVTPPGGKKGHHVDQAAAASTPGGGSKAAETEHGSPRPSSPFPAISLRRTRFSSVPLVQLKHADTEEITFPASVELPRRHVTFYSDVDSDSSLSGGGLCSMSDTMESFKELGASPSTQPSVRIKHLTRLQQPSTENDDDRDYRHLISLTRLYCKVGLFHEIEVSFSKYSAIEISSYCYWNYKQLTAFCRDEDNNKILGDVARTLDK